MIALPRSRVLRQCLLGIGLLGVSSLAMAQNARVSTAPGSETPERSSAEAEDEARADASPAPRRARGNRGAEEASGQRVPRWHSYLPGMIR